MLAILHGIATAYFGLVACTSLACIINDIRRTYSEIVSALLEDY